MIIEQAILHSGVTRNRIADLSGVRLATIGEVVHSLLSEGLIEEPERPDGSRTGRRASPLRIRAQYGCFLGIALSTEQVQAVLLDAAGKPIAPPIARSVRAKNPESVFGLILAVLKEMKQLTGDAQWKKLRAAGFSDPGLVDQKRGRSIKAVNLPGWENVETVQRLSKLLECPVLMRPEMEARAYAERLIEIPADEGCFHLNIENGVGGAYTRGTKPFVGDSFCQMEIGHIVVEEEGALCQCGNHGCLEALVGERGLAQRVEQLTRRTVDSVLVNSEFSLSRFVEAVQEGDKAALRLAVETARQIGRALSAATTLLNPAYISLSGPLFALEDIFKPELRQSLKLHCLPQAVEKLQWRVSSLGDDAPALGVALIARHQNLLNNP